MADTTLTGAEKEVTISNEEIAKADKKKKIIKIVIIAVVLIVGFFLVKKFIFKK